MARIHSWLPSAATLRLASREPRVANRAGRANFVGACARFERGWLPLAASLRLAFRESRLRIHSGAPKPRGAVADGGAGLSRLSAQTFDPE